MEGNLTVVDALPSGYCGCLWQEVKSTRLPTGGVVYSLQYSGSDSFFEKEACVICDDSGVAVASAVRDEEYSEGEPSYRSIEIYDRSATKRLLSVNIKNSKRRKRWICPLAMFFLVTFSFGFATLGAADAINKDCAWYHIAGLAVLFGIVGAVGAFLLMLCSFAMFDIFWEDPLEDSPLGDIAEALDARNNRNTEIPVARSISAISGISGRKGESVHRNKAALVSDPTPKGGGLRSASIVSIPVDSSASSRIVRSV